jgi:hypothetical protein
MQPETPERVKYGQDCHGTRKQEYIGIFWKVPAVIFPTNAETFSRNEDSAIPHHKQICIINVLVDICHKF